MSATHVNLISEENSRPGTSDWWPTMHSPPGAIEAFTTQTSGFPGDRLELCVSTRPAARYATSVYRLGWYGGQGGRLVHQSPSNTGIAREIPPLDAQTGLCRTGWSVTDSISIAPGWTPGQHVCVLTLQSGPFAGSAALVPFVVRRDPGDPPPLLVQFGVNTSQAYNHWGGKSLYPSNSTDNVAAVKVSFDRPVLDWDHANLNSRAPFHYDLPLIRFLEREGFDVGYQTDVDTHREPWTLLTSRALVCAGHDEYWTMEIRNAFERARSTRVHMAFLGANQCYWQARYEDAERTLVVYRSKRTDPVSDPALKTVRWRELDNPRPESWLLGVMYDGGITSPDDLLTYDVLRSAASHRWGAAFADRAPLPELVGYEWDRLDRNFPPPDLTRFLHCRDERSDADCIAWRAPTGALVFAAGSLAFVHGLDDWARPGLGDARVQSLVRNTLREMVGERAQATGGRPGR